MQIIGIIILFLFLFFQPRRHQFIAIWGQLRFIRNLSSQLTNFTFQ
jgi:hypothetical protein